MGNTDRQPNSENIDRVAEVKVQEINTLLETYNQPLRSQNDYIILPFTFWAATSAAATAANYPPIINVAFPMVMLYAYESHGTVESGAATLQVDKLTSTQAQGDGVNLLASGIDLTTTANVPVKYAATATLANRQLAAGDRVEIRQPSGSLSAVRDVCITLYFRVNLKDLPK